MPVTQHGNHSSFEAENYLDAKRDQYIVIINNQYHYHGIPYEIGEFFDRFGGANNLTLMQRHLSL